MRGGRDADWRSSRRATGEVREPRSASWQIQNRGKTMVDNQFSFGFAVDSMCKDLGFCLNEERRSGTTLPITALVDSEQSADRRIARSP